MRFAFLAALVIIAVATSGQSPTAMKSVSNMDSLFCPKGYAAKGHPYLDFRLVSNGTTVDNDRLKGKVVLLNFWFEGCHPCMAEMAALNELADHLKSQKDFVFVSVSRDDSETIRRVIDRFHLSFTVFSASFAESRRLAYEGGYPTSIILDKEGRVKKLHLGGSIDVDKAREFIMKTLLTEIQGLL